MTGMSFKAGKKIKNKKDEFLKISIIEKCVCANLIASMEFTAYDSVFATFRFDIIKQISQTEK